MPEISKQEALFLYKEAPLSLLQEEAQKIRQAKHGAKNVTYVLDTNPNYTNICEIQCSFCAFCRQKKTFHLSPQEVIDHIKKTTTSNITTVLLQGGIHPGVTLDYLVEIVRLTKEQLPTLHPHYFSAPEIWFAANRSNIPLDEALKKLYDAGQRTIPGGGAEILTERVQKKISLKKLAPREWIDVHRRAHLIGFKTTATMMYGHIETAEDIIEHLDLIRSLQAETNGFYSFIPWSYKRQNNPLGHFVHTQAPAETYLRLLALSRIYLHTIDHIAASWFGEGKETGIKALSYGADDFGGILLEESVHKAAGHTNTTTEAEVQALISQTGFHGVERKFVY